MGRGRNGAGRGRGGRPGVRAGRNAGGGAVAGIPAAPATAADVRENNTPPAPVTQPEVRETPRESLLTPTQVSGYGTSKRYSFSTVSGNRVEMHIGSSIDFDVNGSYSRREMPEAERNAISMRLMQIVSQDAKTRPNGHTYRTSAVTGDGHGMERARAYQAVGFSRPSGGVAGRSQYAVVQNGKMRPDNASLAQSERYEGTNSQTADMIWKSATDALKADRQRARASR